jgi:transcriptional regulator with XRE-family HTH domain
MLRRDVAKMYTADVPSIRRTVRRREIANRIKKLRVLLDISQEAAAKQLGIRRVQWTHIEAGRQSVPSERILDLCKILNTTPEDLLGGNQ